MYLNYMNGNLESLIETETLSFILLLSLEMISIHHMIFKNDLRQIDS